MSLSLVRVGGAVGTARRANEEEKEVMTGDEDETKAVKEKDLDRSEERFCFLFSVFCLAQEKNQKKNWEKN